MGQLVIWVNTCDPVATLFRTLYIVYGMYLILAIKSVITMYRAVDAYVWHLSNIVKKHIDNLPYTAKHSRKKLARLE